jgi:hypothetical protein
MRRKISWTNGQTTEVKQYTPSPFGEREYNQKRKQDENKNKMTPIILTRREYYKHLSKIN